MMGHVSTVEHRTAARVLDTADFKIIHPIADTPKDRWDQPHAFLDDSFEQRQPVELLECGRLASQRTHQLIHEGGVNLWMLRQQEEGPGEGGGAGLRSAAKDGNGLADD